MAVGDVAVGIIAVGAIAAGVIAVGGLGFGVVSVGGLALGLVALGGLAVGGVAVGGLAAGFRSGRLGDWPDIRMAGYGSTGQLRDTWISHGALPAKIVRTQATTDRKPNT